MKAITVWERFNQESQQWEHNHIEDGHIEGEKPVGTESQTKGWSKGTWTREHKHLDNNKVI